MVISIEFFQRWIDQRSVWVPFLPARGFPGRVAAMIGQTSIFPVVTVVGDEMGIGSIGLQDLGIGNVKWLPGAPNCDAKS
jgi:hypothetical protein